MTRVSLVIPVLNGARTLPKLFEALDRLEPAPDEILLVDNGSTDESVSLLRSYAARRGAGCVVVLEEPRRGATVARNRGIRAATGDVIAFTDSDCSPASDWLEHLVEPFEDDAVGGVAGRVEGVPESTLLGQFGRLYTLRLPQTPSRHRAWSPVSGGFPTANLAVRRALALELDGFDESIRIYGEDYDFCARIYTQGAEIEYRPSARVSHHHRTRLWPMLKQAFGFGRGHAYLMRRHGRGLLWVTLPRATFRVLRSPLPVWLDLAAADKKLVTIAVASALHPALLWLAPVYLLHLSVAAARRSRHDGLEGSLLRGPGLAALLLAKSAALTAGRFWGSIRYRCVCV